MSVGVNGGGAVSVTLAVGVGDRGACSVAVAVQDGDGFGSSVKLGEGSAVVVAVWLEVGE